MTTIVLVKSFETVVQEYEQTVLVDTAQYQNEDEVIDEAMRYASEEGEWELVDSCVDTIDVNQECEILGSSIQPTLELPT